MRARSIAFTSRSPRMIGELLPIERFPRSVACVYEKIASLSAKCGILCIFFLYTCIIWSFGVVFYPLLAIYLSDSVHLDTLRSSNVRIWASIFRNGHQLEMSNSVRSSSHNSYMFVRSIQLAIWAVHQKFRVYQSFSYIIISCVFWYFISYRPPYQ